MIHRFLHLVDLVDIDLSAVLIARQPAKFLGIFPPQQVGPFCFSSPLGLLLTAAHISFLFNASSDMSLLDPSEVSLLFLPP